MTSKIYSPIEIEVLDKRIPLDIHFIIGKYLGYSHHIYVYINLVHNSKICNDLKLHIYHDCYPFYKMYTQPTINMDVWFENYVIKHISNIVNLHKIMPLFYKRSNKTRVTCDEYMKLYNILVHGYDTAVYDDSDSDSDSEHITVSTCYKLCKTPIHENITKAQCLCAFLAQHIEYDMMCSDEKVSFELKCKEKVPHEIELKEFLRKIKKRNMRLM